MGEAAGWGPGADVRLLRGALLITSLLCLSLALAPAASAEEPPEQFAQFGFTGNGAGQTINPRGIATNPSTGRVYVAEVGNQRVSEFTAWGEFVKAIGWGVVSGGAAGTGDLVAGSTTVSAVVTTSKVFKAGQAINGAGIPAGTTILAVAPGSITLSQPATASGSGVALTSPQGSTNVPVNEQQTVTLSAGVTGGSFELTYTTPNPSNTTGTTTAIPYNATPAEVEAALAALPNIGAGNVSVASPNPGGEAAKGGPYTITFQGTRFADTDVSQMTVVNALTGTSPSATVATTVPGAGAFEICTAGCQAGTAGAGPGQFNNPLGIAVDSAGNIYVVDFTNRRVQKFDSAGNFLLMFGGGVNKTTGGNVCTKAQLEAGDVCGAGTIGTAAGQFGAWKIGSFISSGPGDVVYVGDSERIQRFDTAGAVTGAIALPGCGFAESLTTDPAGNLWVACEQAKIPGVRKIDSVGNVLTTITESGEAPPKALVPKALATDPGGDLYMVDGVTNPIVRKFTSAGVETARFGAGEFTGSTGIGTNSVGDVYVSNFTPTNSYIRAYGPPPNALAPPPPAAATIGAEYATAVGTTTAVLGAEINPNFWPTTYYVQYGAADCSANPCAEQPLPPGTPLSGQGKRLYPTDGVELTGLTVGTTYHYRFVAVSGGGPPTFGEDRTFRTYGLGLGGLPDNRAFEMVSPAAKNSGDAAKPNSDLVDTNSATPLQASPSGDAVTYASVTPFAEPQSAPAASQYLSRRSASGWMTENVTPPDSQGETKPPVRGFSSDLGFAAVIQKEPSLAAGAVPNVENIYWRDNASGAFTALMTEMPRLKVAKERFCLKYAGASADSSHVIFSANGALTPDSLEGPEFGFNLYEWTAAGLRLVNVLPGGAPDPPSESIDFGSAQEAGKCGGSSAAIFHNAISADGSRIFWTDRSAGSRLYARLDGTETIQLDTAQPGASGPSGGGQFWAASDDGSVVFFTAQNKLTPDAGAGDLYRYDVGARTLSSITPGPDANVSGVLGASEDGSHVYFVATAALSGSATAGQPNLYLWREGEGLRFISTLSNADASDWSKRPSEQTARVSPDGRHLAFQSVAGLTGYDNFGSKCVESSTAPVTYSSGLCPEAFLYDSAAGGGLICASCNPSGARPAGATALQPWKTPYDQPRYLSDDGSRLFFTTRDDLVPADTNGQKDIYEFERAGFGTCDATNPALDPQSGGCAFLISGGTAGDDSYFVDASADGRDVFFSSPQRLVPADEDENYDVYDARAGGGFPPPPVPPPPCQGESCKPAPTTDPSLPGPNSDSFQGDGNVPGTRKPGRRCPKGKRAVHRKGKVRCVKRHAHKHHHHKRAHNTGRAAR
jgi:hypothetical protein